MLRLYVVNDDTGAAYPVTTAFESTVVTNDTLNADFNRMRAEVSENVIKAAKQMAVDQSDGTEPRFQCRIKELITG